MVGKLKSSRLKTTDFPVRSGRRIRISRAALHERAAEKLRALIVRGVLKPGERIGEVEVCEALGVSRTPLREALKLLAAEGLIVLRPNRGAMIAPMRREDIDELFEVVAGLERLAAEYAASRMTGLELRRLQGMQVRMERRYEARELDDYFQINQQIHRFVVSCAKNTVLKATHDWLLGRVERARYFALHSRERWDQSLDEHRQILAALEAGDAETAGRLMGAHVLRTGDVVNRTLLADQASAA